ncbi:hypothetical protein DYB32_003365 [Aphanomyces invadans]|uniref:Coiled-coil domain-containing protein 12 n=1 Tax=Aphanomyces invadans TaxID=157072 RepID=A0A3R7D2S5_9STRA|nr:hypothetical protein DYB32_003365 [Aphanomyces invadans]
MDQADRAKRLKALRDAKNKKEGVVPAAEEESCPVPEVVAEAADEAAQGDVATSEEDTTEEVLSIAPMKPTWDLERGLEKQMKKLERRTQNAIVEILRAKMEREMQNEEDDSEDAEVA